MTVPQNNKQYSHDDWADAKPVLVLGLGNILLRDEGVGVRVVERLQRAYRLPGYVEVVDGGTGGMTLLDTIANRDDLIVVDAVKAGHPPGTVVKLCNGALSNLFQTRMSPHQLALTDMLAILGISGEQPKSVMVLGIEPADLTTGIGLSQRIEQQLHGMVELVVSELQLLGIPAVPVGLDDEAATGQWRPAAGSWRMQ